MRVSYIRKIKDQIPLNQKELAAAKFTMMNAIKHQNKGVIEPLLSRGVPLVEPLYDNKSCLRFALEGPNPEIVEMLLIESMRTFQLFPVQDVSDCFDWVLKKRHYHLVDLLLFALNQYTQTQKHFEKELLIISQLDKLFDMMKKNDIQDYHLKEFESILKSMPFKKEIFFFIDFKWNKEVGDRFSKSLDFYKMVSDFYCGQDIQHKQSIVRKSLSKAVVCGGIGIGLIATSNYTAIFMLNTLLLLIGLAFLGCAFYKASVWKKISQSTQANIQNRLLHKACREGNYGLVAELLEKGAQVNALCGMAESTALREAILFKHQPIINFLQQFQAYSGKGSETIFFP